MNRNQYCPEEYAAFQERNQTLLEAEAQTDIDEDYFTAAEKMIDRIKNKPWVPENPHINDKWDIARKQEFAYRNGCQAQFKSLIEWIEQFAVVATAGDDIIVIPSDIWQELRLSL